MPKESLLFRKRPSKELIESILQRCGLLGVHDLRWFSKEELRLEGVEEWLSELEAYYYPCKAKRFFYGRGEPDGDLLITVFRHILSLIGYYLQRQEKLYKGHKQLLYQITPINPFQDLSGASLQVDFS